MPSIDIRPAQVEVLRGAADGLKQFPTDYPGQSEEFNKGVLFAAEVILRTAALIQKDSDDGVPATELPARSYPMMR